LSIHSTGQSKDATLLVKPSDACRLLGCGRTRLYQLLNAGELDSFKDGRSRKITVASIHRFVERRLDASVRSEKLDQSQSEAGRGGRDVARRSRRRSLAGRRRLRTQRLGSRPRP
jgi:excisionase family DNA binding protein